MRRLLFTTERIKPLKKKKKKRKVFKWGPWTPVQWWRDVPMLFAVSEMICQRRALPLGRAAQAVAISVRRVLTIIIIKALLKNNNIKKT